MIHFCMAPTFQICMSKYRKWEKWKIVDFNHLIGKFKDFQKTSDN